jgi:hypothetical protein
VGISGMEIRPQSVNVQARWQLNEERYRMVNFKDRYCG